MQDIWEHLIDTKSNNFRAGNLNVLITDFPLNSKEKKIDSAKVLFDALGV